MSTHETRARHEREVGAQSGAERRRWVRGAMERSLLSIATSVIVGAGLVLAAALPVAAEEPAPAAVSASSEPTAAGASEASQGLVAALSRLQPGQRVRIATADAGEGEGRLAAVREGRLILEDSEIAKRLPGGVPLETVQKAWVRDRGTKRGALIGAVVGGVATGALFALAVGAMCDVPDGCRGDQVKGVAIGVGLGGAGGVLAGTILGAGSSQWRPVSGSSTSLGGLPTRGSIGSVSLQVGHGRGLDALAPDGAAGGRLSWTADLGTIRPGLEIGRFGLGRSSVMTLQGDRPYDESLFHLGPTVALGPSRGSVRPYALVGAGYYRWQAFSALPRDSYLGYIPYDQLEPQDREQLDAEYLPTSHLSFLGGSLGGGVLVDTKTPLSFSAEARWHTNLTQDPATQRRLSAFSVTAGATYRW